MSGASPQQRNPRRFTRPLTLADGFDPLALPDLTPPAPGVQPADWLIDPATSATDREEYLQRFVAGFGTVDPTDLELDLVPRTHAEVIEGYLTQRVRINFNVSPAVTADLTVAPQGPADQLAGQFPFTAPVAIIGTTAPSNHPDAAPGRRLDQEMADLLAGRGVQSWPAVAVAADHQWIDPVLIADFTEPNIVAFAAVVHLQPYLAMWRPGPGAGALEVLDLADPLAPKVMATAPAGLGQVSHRCCAMIPGAGCGQLCKMHGGPWISRSITAAMRWETRRDRMIRALGCDTCDDGAIRVALGHVGRGGRAAVPVRPDTATPTRHDRVVPQETSPLTTLT